MSINVYQIVTDRIMEALEQGTVPWQKPWTGVRSGAYSRSTGKPYSLLNQILLGKPGEYLTYKQVQDAGGQVRKGEKASFVVFWKMFPKIEKNKDGKEVKVVIPLLKYFNVFHIDQCEGVQPKYKAEDLRPTDPIEEAENILTNYSERSGCPIINAKQDRAYYSPLLDEIHLPLREQFPEIKEYYSTAFHEATHSTGHKTRLNRLTATAHFGNEEYSKEELVAEIGSAILMNEMGLEMPSTFKNSAAYIQSWLKALKNDSRMVVSAAGKAEKAVRMILNIQDEKEVCV